MIKDPQKNQTTLSLASETALSSKPSKPTTNHLTAVQDCGALLPARQPKYNKPASRLQRLAEEMYMTDQLVQRL